MAYKGSDLDLRLARAASVRESAGDHHADVPWLQASRPGSPMTVEEPVLATCNSAFDVALFHAADAVRLEHLLHALTRVGAGSDLLAELGVRIDRLRRETAAAIAADMPGGSIERPDAPPASAALEDVLRRAAELAARRRSPTSLADVLRALLGGGPGSPAASMLLRAANDPQRLERWRDEPRREVLAPLPVAEVEPRAPQPPPGALDALRGELGHMATALQALREEAAADRKALGELLREVRAELPDLRTLREEASADRKGFADLLREVRAEMHALRQDASQAAAGAPGTDALSALLDARLGGLGKATAELAGQLPAITQLVGAEPSQQLLTKLEAVEERIELRALEAADKVAVGLAERLERAEANLRRLQETSDRHWTSSGERQVALDASVRAQLQSAEETGKVYERHMGEIYQALVKLGANQQTLGDNFATWRSETGGDIGIVNNRLQQLERTLLDLLGQLGIELHALRGEAAVDAGRRGNGFKRWLYGTNSVFASGRRGGAEDAGPPPGREQAS